VPPLTREQKLQKLAARSARRRKSLAEAVQKDLAVFREIVRPKSAVMSKP